MIGYTSQEGYEHEDSKAIRGNKFCCLLLDEVNQEDMTENRIKTWVTQLRDEGLFQNDSKNVDNFKLPEKSSKVAKLSFSEEETISTLKKENINLRRLIKEQSSLLKMNNQEFLKKGHVNGYTPHLNKKTGRIMWMSPDGRTCYYTIKSNVSV
jgi:flavodoxin I